MNAERQVITDGALAIRGDRVVAVGKRAVVEREVVARETLDGRRFVMTPGFVDAHIHITGDPLTRGFIRGAPGGNFGDTLTRWVIPLFRAQTPDDEQLSAQCAALSMMRHGTTCFMEAGTVTHLDAVMEGLSETGIRGRVGEWVEGQAYDPSEDQAKLSATPSLCWNRRSPAIPTRTMPDWRPGRSWSDTRPIPMTFGARRPPWPSSMACVSPRT